MLVVPQMRSPACSKASCRMLTRAVARLVLAEGLEQQPIRVHGDHGVQHIPGIAVGHEQPVEVLALGLVEGGEHLVAGLAQVLEFGADFLGARLGAAGVGHEGGEHLRFVLLQPFAVGRLVAAARAQVADHHAVQRGQPFAHLQVGRAVAPEQAVEARGWAQQVGREGEGLLGRRVVDLRAAVVLIAKFHVRSTPCLVAALRLKTGPGRAAPPPGAA